MAKLLEKIYFMNAFHEYVDEDNIDYVLDKAVEETEIKIV